jgi:hypothetical protein
LVVWLDSNTEDGAQEAGCSEQFWLIRELNHRSKARLVKVRLAIIGKEFTRCARRSAGRAG